MKTLAIYTDGACSGNPGPGGWAAILIYGQAEKVLSGAEPDTTNNRMELLAVIKGLEAITKPCPVTIYSDSTYVVNAVNENWLQSWQKNNWLTSSKKTVKNRDLWESLIGLNELHRPRYVKIKGHSDNEYNNRCDALAVGAIKEYKARQKSTLTKINFYIKRKNKNCKY